MTTMQNSNQNLEEKNSMPERLQRLKEKILADDPNFTNEAIIRAGTALIALVSMFLPWVVLDGTRSALSGSELVAYAFTSKERGTMFQTSFMGAVALLYIPLIVTIATVVSFSKTIVQKTSTTSNLLGCLLPVIMIMVSGSITSSDRPDLLGVTVPEWGIVTMISCHVILLVHGLIQENDRK